MCSEVVTPDIFYQGDRERQHAGPAWPGLPRGRSTDHVGAAIYGLAMISPPAATLLPAGQDLGPIRRTLSVDPRVHAAELERFWVKGALDQAKAPTVISTSAPTTRPTWRTALSKCSSGVARV